MHEADCICSSCLWCDTTDRHSLTNYMQVSSGNTQTKIFRAFC